MNHAYPAIAALLATALASAQGTITDNNVVFTIASIPTTTTSTNGLGNFTAGSGLTDVMYQHWWYYRVGGDLREYAFNNGDTNGDGNNQQGFVQNWLTDTAILQWQDVDERGTIAAVWILQAVSTGANEGMTLSRMSITNRGATPITINAYAYLDIDLCSLTTNTATGTGRRQTIVASCAGQSVEWLGVGIDRWEAATYAGIRGRLLDNTVTDLANATLPYGPGDYTGAFQWKDRPLAPGASLTFVAILSHNHQACEREAASTTYGNASAGSNGVPSIATNRMPVIGRTAELRVTQALGNANGVVIAGLGRANIQLGNVTLLTNSVADGPIAFDAVGSGSLALPVPNLPALCGAVLDLQCLFLDQGAVGIYPVVHTQGLEWTLGGY